MTTVQIGSGGSVAQFLVDKGFTDGGCTIRVQECYRDDQPTSNGFNYRFWEVDRGVGYFVGGVTQELIVSYTDTTWGEIERWVNTQLNTLVNVDDLNEYSDPDDYTRLTIYLGSWKNDETGNVHLDRSVWVDDLDTALALGREYQQISIWDIKNAEAIYLTPVDAEAPIAA